MNRRKFLGWVAAVGASGYANGQREYVPFYKEQVVGCSRVNYHDGGEKFFANLKSGRQVQVTEKEFLRIFNLRDEL